MINYKSTNLFTFIIDCYREIDNSPFKDILPQNNIWDFDSYLKYNAFYSLQNFVRYLEEKKYVGELSNKQFLSSLLLFIDSSIYYFDEYDQLFIRNDDSALNSEDYTLIISPQNSIYKQIGKYVSLKNRNDGLKGLRKRRHFNPKKTCCLLGFKNLNFAKKNGEYTVKQTFCICESLSRNLDEGLIKVSFAPFVRIDVEGKPLYSIIKKNSHFSISYSNGFEDVFKSYLSNVFKESNSLIIMPEICNPLTLKIETGALLKQINRDFSKLIVAGTNWNKGNNTCFVFDDDGNLLVEQAKYNPFFLEDDNTRLYEDIASSNSSFEVTLLNVKSFGLIGFPICSDLLDAKYIESIYCDCSVTSIISPCMSKSKDIIASLSSLSSLYGISVFVCNSYYGNNNMIGYYSLPRKIKKTKERSYYECFIKAKKTKIGDNCLSIRKIIKLKNYTK